MKYEELLREINDFNVSVLNVDQLKTLKEALQVKTSCISYYQRVAYGSKKLANNQKKCED